MYMLSIKLVFHLFVIYYIVKNASSFSFGDKNQPESITNEGLYNANDHVVIFNISNLDNTIHGSKIAWVVEFYSSWCGHCQRFAPIWKSLARSIKPWRDIVDVAAIDCANNDNNPLCREYEITSYPMIRYFSPNTKIGGIGISLDQVKNEEIMENHIIKQLENDQEAGIGMEWPNITPCRSSELEDVWKGVRANVVYKFLLFEQTDSFLGRKVILDFHNTTEILIRRVTSDNQMLCMNYQVTSFPSLFAIDRGGVRTKLKIITPTRLGVMNLINHFIQSKGLTSNVSKIYTNNEFDKNGNMKTSQSIMDTVANVIDDDIALADLEAVVHYSLEHEIPLQKTIHGLQLTALKNYLAALAEYLPLKNGKSLYFRSILNAINENNSIKGEDFYKLVNSTAENMSPVYTTNKQWVRCKGSNPRLRGYPCGLWTLFHTLTANYAAVHSQLTSINSPTKILSAIHGYVKYFFGCADCSDHFVNMAEKLKIFQVKSADESILWLWQAHNEVNERLSGDVTEDPKFPKIQYPSKIHCPQCRNNDDEWNLTQVLKYLKKKYINSDVEYNNISEPHYLKLIRTELPINKNITHQQKIGWDFTLFDISICVVLYITSAVILTLVCIKFLVKRSSKKKMQIHSLFLRV
ncbi:hypothetical protein PV327_007290 [Microctonus hyperodae]|uniref:Sulfhydryl oxidase n=1 Tax=Microctonus hyperodae TaxID=165561 RepID=A0AA39F655_MICHY|nr:hypothetical protein PV327_007290 [Microctonus hyperodae]